MIQKVKNWNKISSWQGAIDRGWERAWPQSSELHKPRSAVLPKGTCADHSTGVWEPCESSEQLCSGALEHRRVWVPCATPVFSPHCSQHGLPPAHSDLLFKKKKRLQWLLRPTLKCWSDSLAWHSGCWEILGLMSCLATFNALGLPICDTYSHLWAFVQAFYLEGCSSPTFCSFGYLSLMLQVLY